MAKITISQAHTLTAADAQNALSAFAEDLKKFGASLDWKGGTATIKGMGVSGELRVTNSSADLNLKLGLLAKAAGVDPVRLKASIEKRFRKALLEEA